MTAGDAAAVARLTGELGYPSTSDAIARRFADLRGRADHEVLVALPETGEEPVGWIHVERAASLASDAHVVIAGLVVADEHRGTGIGADLLAAAERWAVDHGAHEVVVRTRTTRAGAHRFYEREGYRLTKESRVYAKVVRTPDG